MRKKTILLYAFLLAVATGSDAQVNRWIVPDEHAKLVNPLEMNPRNIATGKNAFARNCVACHGEKADGKGLMESSSLITDTFHLQSDGIIFTKISTGRDKMPPFKGMLKDEEIWSIVHYLRVLVNPSAIPPAKDLKIELSANNEKKTLTAFVCSLDTPGIPLPEIDVQFYVQMDFGLLPISKSPNFTGTDGKVTVIFPDRIMGDHKGNVQIIGKIENNFLYNNAEISMVQAWGLALKTQDDFFNQRSLWGARDKSPVWLLLLANGIIVGVWAVIFFVIFNLFRIKKAGKIYIQ